MNVYIQSGDITDMQGPCPTGYHVPLNTERQAIYDAGVSLGAWNSSNGTNLSTYLKLPMTGYRDTDLALYNVNSRGYYWSSTRHDINTYAAYIIYFYSSSITPQGNISCSTGMPIRCLKDSPVVPTSSWTTLYQGSGNAGIFHNPTDGLISISSNGTNWYTIQDKNLGATTVYNYGDTLTNDNCGNGFQWGNNYAFPGTKSSDSITTSSTKVDASNYGPGNYYDSSTWITRSPRDTTNNYNLRGGETGPVSMKEVQNMYIGEYGWKPGANTTLYLPLNGNITDPHNQVTYSWVGTSSFDTWSTGVQAANLTGSNAINLGASTDFEQGTGEMTVLFWFTTSSPSTEQRCEFRSSAYCFTMQVYSSILEFQCVNSSTPDGWNLGTTTLTSGTKYLAALTMKENGQAILYLNGNVETTINIGTFQTYSFQHGQYIGTGRMGSSDSSFWRGMIKDFIIENRERTAQEISDYYNQTKSNYGL